MYSVHYDANGRPFVVVEEDILNSVPRRNWVEAIKKVLTDRFPDGVKVGNNFIKINNKTRRKMIRNIQNDLENMIDVLMLINSELSDMLTKSFWRLVDTSTKA